MADRLSHGVIEELRKNKTITKTTPFEVVIGSLLKLLYHLKRDKSNMDVDKINAEIAVKQECVVCGFSDYQEDIIETPDGYVHKECLTDFEQKHREYPQDELDKETESEKAFVRQEINSHLHL